MAAKSIEQRFKSSKAPQREDNSLSDKEQNDLRLALGLASKAIFSEEGEKMLMQGLQSAEPKLVVGQFVGMLMLQMRKSFEDKKKPVSDRIWMAQGGFVEQVVEDIDAAATKNGMDLDDETKQSVYMEVAEMMKGISQGGKGPPGGEQQGQPTQGGPPPGPGGPPPQGGGAGPMGPPPPGGPMMGGM